MSTLIERLEASAAELARRSIAEMYDNPFWQARFGDRGRENADRDGAYHVSYLIQALAANDASVMTNYARWLQTLLVSRGMSSRHIAENFERLSRAIRAEVAEPEPALELLASATRALVYDAGPARELQQLAVPLAQAVVDELERTHTAWFAAASSYPSLAALDSIEQAERARFEDEVLDFVAYLADALHAARPELFVGHVLWTQAYQVRRRAPHARVEQTLRALREGLAAPLPGLSVAPELAVQAALVLDTAIDELHRTPATDPTSDPASPA
jgi:hypothetical protein